MDAEKDDSHVPDDGLVERLRAEVEFQQRLLDLDACADVPLFLRAALDLLAGIAGARHGYLRIRHPATEAGGLEFHATRGCDEDETARISHTVSGGIIAAALAEGRSVRTADARADPRFRERRSVLDHGIQAVLCVPVSGRDVQGVIYLQGLETARGFSDEVVERIERAARRLVPAAERLLLRGRVDAREDRTADVRRTFRAPGLIGRSEALARVLRDAALVAPLPVNVLITGPTGTGKSALARAVWANSPRASGPFVEVNCANLNGPLLESELFGHERGAHSTATERRGGKVAAAHGGILFLDEVGDLPLDCQAKLLQFVQERTYFRVGSAQAESADVRIVAATNLDIEAAVRERRFRPDLRFRLEVLPLRMPALSERRSDVADIAASALATFNERAGLPPQELSFTAAAALEAAEWPGNVRQLVHAVEAAAIRARAEGARLVEARHAFPDVHAEPDAEAHPTWQQATLAFQGRLLKDTLDALDWDVSAAADRLGLSRAHTYALIQTHALRRGGDASA